MKVIVNCHQCKGRGKLHDICGCRGMVGSACLYCSGNWDNLFVECDKCKGSGKIEYTENLFMLFDKKDR